MSLIHHQLQSPEEREMFLQSFDVSQKTFVVADLRSKYEVQKRLLEDRPILEEMAVVRAAELWEKSLMRLQPGRKLLSSSLTNTLVNRWLQERQIPWARTPGVVSLVLEYLQQLLPLLVDDQRSEPLQEWFEDNPRAVKSWGQWYYLCRELWKVFEEQNWLPRSVSSAALVGEEGLGELWGRDFVVDLGADLSLVESEIFLTLSKSCDVLILSPEPLWKSLYQDQFMPYALLRGEGFFKGNQNENDRRGEGAQTSLWNDPLKNVSQVSRYSTMITEVKATVSDIRKHLEEGVEISDMTLVVTDLEAYWPSLRVYLEQEGVPFDKSQVEGLQSFPQVNAWISELRIRCQQLQSNALEQAIYAGTEVPSLSYDRFQKLYTWIVEADDLKRDPSVAERFSDTRSPATEVSREEFLSWALSFWNKSSRGELLDRPLALLLSECSESMRLSYKQWLNYLESLVAKVEVTRMGPSSQGLQVVGLDSYPFSTATHVWVMGATEAQLVESQKTALTLQDIQGLSESVGTSLSLPDQYRREFLLMWGLQRASQKVSVSFPSTDFSGAVQTPSRLWLQAALSQKKEVEELDSPGATRWDEVQQSDLSVLVSLRSWSESHLEMLEKRLQWDLKGWSEEELSTHEFDPFAKLAKRLSASSLEDYLKCPFVFLSKRLFRLSDLPSLDLDIDRMTRGSFMHKALELLLEESPNKDWSDEELDALLESSRQSEGLHFVDGHVWESYRNKQKWTLRRFLKAEREWRALWPKTQTVGRELKLEFAWSPEQKSFVTSGQGEWIFLGFIDRVDMNDKNEYVVLDYKSSTSSMSNFNQWVKKGELQLGIYAQALNHANTGLPGGKVVGAFYYDLREMERKKGFGQKDSEHHMFPTDKRSAALVSEDGLRIALAEFNENLYATIEKIRRGRLQPQPRQLEDCQSCRWRNLCRAPHLN